MSQFVRIQHRIECWRLSDFYTGSTPANILNCSKAANVTIVWGAILNQSGKNPLYRLMMPSDRIVLMMTSGMDLYFLLSTSANMVPVSKRYLIADSYERELYNNYSPLLYSYRSERWKIYSQISATSSNPNNLLSPIIVLQLNLQISNKDKMFWQHIKPKIHAYTFNK